MNVSVFTCFPQLPTISRCQEPLGEARETLRGRLAELPLRNVHSHGNSNFLSLPVTLNYMEKGRPGRELKHKTQPQLLHSTKMLKIITINRKYDQVPQNTHIFTNKVRRNTNLTQNENKTAFQIAFCSPEHVVNNCISTMGNCE